MSRLDNFGFYKLDHIRVDQRAFTIIFLNNPELFIIGFSKFKIRQHQKEKNKSPQTIERRNESICGRTKRSINTESP